MSQHGLLNGNVIIATISHAVPKDLREAEFIWTRRRSHVKGHRNVLLSVDLGADSMDKGVTETNKRLASTAQTDREELCASRNDGRRMKLAETRGLCIPASSRPPKQQREHKRFLCFWKQTLCVFRTGLWVCG